MNQPFLFVEIILAKKCLQVTFDGKDDDSLISNWTGRWELLRGMIRNFVTSLRPRVFYVVALNKEKTKQRKISAAVEILGDDTSDEPADANTRLIRPGWLISFVFDSSLLLHAFETLFIYHQTHALLQVIVNG